MRNLADRPVGSSIKSSSPVRTKSTARLLSSCVMMCSTPEIFFYRSGEFSRETYLGELLELQSRKTRRSFFLRTKAHEREKGRLPASSQFFPRRNGPAISANCATPPGVRRDSVARACAKYQVA